MAWEMKNAASRLLCLLLTLLLLTPALPVRAEGLYGDASGHWAEAALLRAVGEGLLVGSGDKLAPDGAVSRAQAAVILNRVLGAEEAADLTGKTDVPVTAWYYDAMAKAVSLGYLTVPRAAVMERAMTRQEMFAVLAAAFSLNLAETDETALAAFSDGSGLTGAFRRAAASLCGQGLLAGSGGRLRPGDKATRAEFVTLLYRITDTFAVAGCGETAPALKAGESAVLRCDELTSLTADGAQATVVFAQRAGDAYLSQPASQVIVGPGGGTVTVAGSVKRLDVTGAGRTVAITGFVEKLIVGADAQVTVTGAVGQLIAAADCTVTGTGRVNSAEVRVPTAALAVCPGGYARLGGVEAALDAPQTLAAGEKLTVTAALKNAPAGAVCGYTWFVGGTAAESGVVPDDGKLTYTPTVAYSAHMADTMALGLLLTVRTDGALESRYFTASVQLQNYPASHYYGADAARVLDLVTTYQYPTAVLYDGWLYADSALRTRTRYVPAGTEAVCVSSEGSSAAQLRLTDGAVGWISPGSIRCAAGNCTRSEDYAAADKEIWVNAKDYTSATDSLVWVSLSCQKVNVFTRGTGGWELCRTFSCASGANASPTPTGSYAISYHQTRWDYGSYWCGPITGFYGGYAFHSWLNRPDGSAYNHALGQPVSHGCIRMEDAGAQYLYTLPMNTRVVVF